MLQDNSYDIDKRFCF